MELIDRYVYAVTKRLPPKQRADIEQELRSLIEDMLAARTKGAQPTQADIEAVLAEIGEPWKVANNYLNTKQYLVSPELYGVYKIVLCVVLACVAFGITVAMIVSAATQPQNLFAVFANWLASLFSSLLGAFAFVTISFAVIDRVRDTSARGKDIADKIQEGFEKGAQEVRQAFEQGDHNQQHRAHQHGPNQHGSHTHGQEPWRPSDLPRVPHEDTRIRMSEPIAGIVLTCIWLAIVNFAPWILGAHSYAEGQYLFVPFFDLAVLQTYLVYINALAVFMILIYVAQLFTGHWNVFIALAKIVHNVFSALLFINMFTNPALFDGLFFERTARLFNFPADASNVMTIMDSVFFRVFFFIVLVGLFADSITVLVKGIRGSTRS